MESYRPTTKAKEPRVTSDTAGLNGQLRLVPAGPWRLSEAARAIGREGLANARAALEAARRQAIDQAAVAHDQPSAAA